MSQQGGYGYSPPEGYYQPHPEANHTFAAHGTTQYNPTDSGIAPQLSHEKSISQAVDTNRNVIPGLALGASNGAATGWQQSWPGAPTGAGTVGQVSALASALQGGANNSDTRLAPDVHAGAHGETAEEGEVSEGELEDIYEPRYSDEEDVPARDRPNCGEDMASGAPTASTNESNDRMGSYSPYLSPQEVDQGELADSENSPGDSQQPSATITLPYQHQLDSVKTLSRARKQAQDAILRLWPLNVRYQEYLDEGIDRDILQNLFSDLGLDVSAVSSRSIEINDLPASKPTAQDPSASTPTVAPVEAVASVEEPAEPAATVEKKTAEERKDRIARLLAAKGSKQNTPPSGMPTTESVPTTASAAPKPRSEKSKLLQQKMEALKKAREAQLQKLAQTDAQSQHEGGGSQDNKPMPTPVVSSQERSRPAGNGANNRPSPEPDARKPPTPIGHQKRPVAADLNEEFDIPFKRPFGQSRQAQRFLIDVSDDEGDEAMDLDSPEQRPASIHRLPSTEKNLTFQDPRDAHDGANGRGRSSPIATPPVMFGGKTDLESMNKKIEAMKRKIAEAEARKKGRPSMPSSPGTDQVYPSSAASGTPLISSPGSDYQGATAMNVANEPSTRLPKVSDKRSSRSRSRAASERLPIIEAHRKEQLLKLQALQSQVKKMEKEIQESLQEEERLRNESVEESVSGDEHDAEMQPDHAPADKLADSYLATITTSNGSLETSPTAGPAPHPVTGGDSVGPAAAAIEPSDPPSKEPGETVAQPNTEETVPVDIPADLQPEPGNGDTPMAGQPANGASATSEVIAPAQPQTLPDELSDDYEPPEAESLAPDDESMDESDSDSSAALDQASEELETQPVSTTSPITQPISTGQEESKPGSPREVVYNDEATSQVEVKPTHRTGFLPYETPLKYFRAYRFHPLFQQEVPAGLRSLTYSNKIDVKKELCPDELAGLVCPRGDQCEYQHFGSMQAPDDQILVQLGASDDYKGEQRQEFINGLRQLLTDFRNREVKDFATISQSIIDYRARFRNDASKVLPLGDVNI